MSNMKIGDIHHVSVILHAIIATNSETFFINCPGKVVILIVLVANTIILHINEMNCGVTSTYRKPYTA